MSAGSSPELFFKMEVRSIFTITVEEIFVCGRVFARSRPNEAGQQIQGQRSTDTNGKNTQTTASTLTSVSRRVCQQIRDKAVRLPLRSILGLLHGDLVYM